jgi:hypothetical protein
MTGALLSPQHAPSLQLRQVPPHLLSRYPWLAYALRRMPAAALAEPPAFPGAGPLSAARYTPARHPLQTQALGPAAAPIPRPLRAPRRGLRILAMDGGGIRGLLEVEVLRRIELELGRPIAECFDLIAGTSTGGMITVALCARKSLDEIAAHYETIRTAFQGQSALFAEVKRFTVGASHNTAAAEAVLQSFFRKESGRGAGAGAGLGTAAGAEAGTGATPGSLHGAEAGIAGAAASTGAAAAGTPGAPAPGVAGAPDGSAATGAAGLGGPSSASAAAAAAAAAAEGNLHMSDLPPSPKCFVVAASLSVTPPLPYLFRSYELTAPARAFCEFVGTSNVYCHEAVRATTAAPTFYSPAQLYGGAYCDGAILANSPVLVALCEAGMLWPGAHIDCVVSIGTGTLTPKPQAPNGVLHWVKTMCELAMSGGMPNKIAGSLVGADRFFRFDAPGCGDWDLVEMRLPELARMLEEGRRYVARRAADGDFARLRAAMGIRAGFPSPEDRPETSPYAQAAATSAREAAGGGSGGSVAATGRPMVRVEGLPGGHAAERDRGDAVAHAHEAHAAGNEPAAASPYEQAHMRHGGLPAALFARGMIM